MKPLLYQGRFVVCPGCNRLVDKSGDAIEAAVAKVDPKHQKVLNVAYADCKMCKWRRLSISQEFTLSPLNLRQIHIAATV